MIKIGSTIYYRHTAAILYNKAKVFGESSRSWHCLRPDAPQWELDDLKRYAKKVPKNLINYALGTKEDADLAVWVLEHRHRIGSVVTGQDANMLLKIAHLINYDELPKADKL